MTWESLGWGYATLPAMGWIRVVLLKLDNWCSHVRAGQLVWGRVLWMAQQKTQIWHSVFCFSAHSFLPIQLPSMSYSPGSNPFFRPTGQVHSAVHSLPSLGLWKDVEKGFQVSGPEGPREGKTVCILSQRKLSGSFIEWMRFLNLTFIYSTLGTKGLGRTSFATVESAAFYPTSLTQPFTVRLVKEFTSR